MFSVLVVGGVGETVRTCGGSHKHYRGFKGIVLSEVNSDRNIVHVIIAFIECGYGSCQIDQIHSDRSLCCDFEYGVGIKKKKDCEFCVCVIF